MFFAVYRASHLGIKRIFILFLEFGFNSIINDNSINNIHTFKQIEHIY